MVDYYLDGPRGPIPLSTFSPWVVPSHIECELADGLAIEIVASVTQRLDKYLHTGDYLLECSLLEASCHIIKKFGLDY